MELLFKEKQKFTQWWLWLIMTGIAGFFLYGIVVKIISERKFSDDLMLNMGLILVSLFIFGLIYFMWYLTLITEINSEGIKMNFIPFLKKDIKWNDIKSAKIVNYGFVGYGIRYGSTYGTVYNTNGKMGLAIELKDGKKFVIGTQKEKELNDILDKCL